MGKRKEKRRLRRQERRERTPEEREVARAEWEEAAAEQEATPSAAVRGVSWMGLIGSGMGFVSMGTLAVVVLVDPGEASRTWALLFALPAVGFLPALWASVAPTPVRMQVLRGTVIGCLLLAFAGSFLLGLIVAVLLMPATALLAIAAGLIFQGRSGAAQKSRR